MARLRLGGFSWAKAWLYGLITVALFANFLANDRPLVASVDGETGFPALAKLGADVGLTKANASTARDWYRAETDWALWPPIPYDGVKSDLANGNYRSPFATQSTGNRSRHYLGTDRLGRDVAAGLIYGTRVALFVGFGSVLLSLLIGVPLGGAAGFFGNAGLRFTGARLLGTVLGFTVGLTYTVVALAPYLGLKSWFSVGFVMVLAGAGLSIGLSALLHLIPSFRRPMNVRLDGIVLQLIELFVNIPGLIFLLAVLALAPQPSIWLLTAVMGVVAWPVMARFVRAEFLRIRSLPYIEAVMGSNIGPWRVLFFHALPNAVGPLTIIVAFAVGSAILAEGFLSFLGVGIPSDVVTWGTLLRRSREQPAAWWLAVFPGLVLTFTILAVQVLGERRG